MEERTWREREREREREEGKREKGLVMLCASVSAENKTQLIERAWRQETEREGEREGSLCSSQAVFVKNTL